MAIERIHVRGGYEMDDDPATFGIDFGRLLEEKRESGRFLEEGNYDVTPAESSMRPGRYELTVLENGTGLLRTYRGGASCRLLMGESKHHYVRPPIHLPRDGTSLAIVRNPTESLIVVFEVFKYFPGDPRS